MEQESEDEQPETGEENQPKTSENAAGTPEQEEGQNQSIESGIKFEPLESHKRSAEPGWKGKGRRLGEIGRPRD